MVVSREIVWGVGGYAFAGRMNRGRIHCCRREIFSERVRESVERVCARCMAFGICRLRAASGETWPNGIPRYLTQSLSGIPRSDRASFSSWFQGPLVIKADLPRLTLRPEKRAKWCRDLKATFMAATLVSGVAEM